MKKRYYVAYGSNLNLQQMRYRCPDARVVGTAWIEDYELLFKGSQTGAYLTIEPKAGSKVPVAVWAVTGADEASLDRYEGYPRFYYKKDMTLEVTGIRSGKKREMDCFVYIMDEKRKVGIPSDSYVAGVLRGYISFGFDEHYLADASIRAEREVEQHESKHHFHWI